MQFITEITDDPKQQMSVVSEDGDVFELYLEYRESQGLWFANVVYGSTVINGIGLVKSANLLRQWKNIIPFGISITCTDKGDPYYLEDFSKKRCQLVVLTAAEVLLIEDEIYGV